MEVDSFFRRRRRESRCTHSPHATRDTFFYSEIMSDEGEHSRTPAKAPGADGRLSPIDNGARVGLPEVARMKTRHKNLKKKIRRRSTNHEDESVDGKMTTGRDAEESDDDHFAENTDNPLSVEMTMVKGQASANLKHGMLVKDKNRGPGGSYVLVPKGWRRPDDEYLEEIFNALNIDLPPLIFRTDKCPKVFPDLGLQRNYTPENNDPYSAFSIKYSGATEEEKELFESVMKSRMKSCMREISNACLQCKAIFMMFRPSAVNEIDKMITDSLTPGSVALGVVDQSPHTRVLISPEMFAKMVENSVPITEEVTVATSWNKRRDESSGQLVDEPNVNVDLTHILLFEDTHDKQFFVDAIENAIPIGLLCAGGAQPLFESSVRALNKGTPLFVFKHTVKAGHCFSSMLEYYNDIRSVGKDKSGGKKLINVASIRDRLLAPEAVASRIADEYSSADRQGGKKGVDLATATQQEKGDSTGPFDIDPDMRRDCLAIAHNWPTHFDDTCVLHIDLLKDRPENLLMGIINVMASVYGSTLELGGSQAEKDVIQYSFRLHSKLNKLEKHQRTVAVYMRTIITLLGFLTTSAATVFLYMKLEHADHYTKTATVILKAANITLPILLGIFVTIYTAFAPVSKWASLTAAKAKVKSEYFRYMCRVGEYRGGKGVSNHRVAFSQKLQMIWESVSEADVVGDMSITEFGRINKMTDMLALFVPKTGEDGRSGNNSGSRLAGAKVSPAQIENGNKKKRSSNNTKDDDMQDASLMSLDDSNDEGVNQSTVRAISGDIYIQKRVEPEMKRLTRNTPMLARYWTSLQVIIIFCSSIGAILAMYNLELWIPVVLAFSHMLELTINFRQWPLKYQRNSNTYVRLEQILLWWRGLTLIQQRVPHYKMQLVERVENLIMSEVEMITQAQLKKEEDSQNDTAAESDGKKPLKKKSSNADNDDS